MLQAGVGTTGSLDIDALAFDTNGSMYLSFRDDELIYGDVVPLADGALIAFPATVISYDAAGNISGLGAGTTLEVLNETDVDAIVASIGLDDGSGGKVKTIGDLQALDLDPKGGTFVGADLVTLWPNLLFAGSDNGPRILTTAGGGAIGSLNGVPLGEAPTTTGSYLGLDGTGNDITSIHVITDRRDPLCLDLEGSGLTPGDLADALWVGNATPFGVGLMFAAAGPTAAGSNFPSVPLSSAFRFPALYAVPWFSIVGIGFDGAGRFALPFLFPPGVPFDVNVIVQIADITSAPAQFSAPVVIFYDA